ncbi:hypothetical protein AVEN_23669-1 [Araneus ventricosus]|uniref:Uncharacterized protein n=1 Tax=Araneus ventricosus TaxID=182803 RepID=A0A4Y2BJ52_ARAVE|nr:hypothetical protein AVEN_23669-1 [Araneus ventricosus]
MIFGTTAHLARGNGTLLPSREKPQTPDIPVWLLRNRNLLHLGEEKGFIHLADRIGGSLISLSTSVENKFSPNEVGSVCQMLWLILYPFPSFLRLVDLRRNE